MAGRRRGGGASGQGWREAGASHLSINTMHAGLANVDAHLEVLGRVAEGLGLA